VTGNGCISCFRLNFYLSLFNIVHNDCAPRTVGRRMPQMKTDLNRAGGPKPLRRTAARTSSVATKQRRFQEVDGLCEACGELIGDGTDWRRAVYHHRQASALQNALHADLFVLAQSGRALLRRPDRRCDPRRQLRLGQRTGA